MKITKLLAKSDGTTLLQHTDDVVAASITLHEILKAAPDVSRSAFYHDFGKSGVFFQEKMYGGLPPNWYRHELFSLLLALSLGEQDRLHEANLAALATHHRNLDHDDLVRWMESGSAKKLAQLAGEQLKYWRLSTEIYGELPTHLEAVETIRFLRNLRKTAEENSVWTLRGHNLASHRAALVASDHLASSGVGISIAGSNITLNALKRYMRNNCKSPDGSVWKDWNDIQKETSRRIGSAVLTAPTGAGKTEAALRWVLNNRKGGKRRYARIFYVLPYQVSINAMAERLSRVFPDADGNISLIANDTIAILHSNTDLAYLKDAMRATKPEKEITEKQRAEAVKSAKRNREAAHKIYSPVKVTTVYQLLNIFFGRKFFEVGLLELSNYLIVFDEIHAYDGHTMGLILTMFKFLRKLDARIFIMTATLPQALKVKLMDAAGIDTKNEIMLTNFIDADEVLHQDKLLTEVRRKICCHSGDLETLLPEIEAELRQGKKTVVVCNSVKKSIEMAVALKAWKPLLVHSRFCLGDRAKRETKENIGAHNLVISTQVIEVSLDVSFERMFTELAPADALLQRFGRVNRHAEPSEENMGRCWIACGKDSASDIIYSPALLEATKNNIPKPSDVLASGQKWISMNFTLACQWIEAVYPNGMVKTELEKMDDNIERFRSVVENLRPMLDPPADIGDLEKNLFNTVQVVPAKFAEKWYEMKKQGRHMEAKNLLVNVNKAVWCQCCREYEGTAYDTIILGKGKRQQEQIIALFDYDLDASDQNTGTGLRLDIQVSNPRIKYQIWSDEDDD